MQQPPPSGYGPYSQPGYGPPSGYGQQGGYPQQQPPPKKGMSALQIILIVFGGIAVLFMGSCLVCAGIGGRHNSPTAGTDPDRPSQSPGSRATPAAKPTPPAAVAEDVALTTLLSEYKDNEVRADGLYKGHLIKTTGKVDHIKKDILGDMYVTVGTGKQFEIPQVQCTLKSSNAAVAATLNKGDTVTVQGKVSGLMMNVQVGDCDVAK